MFSMRGVVVSTKLVEPSVPGAAWTTTPATVWETTECHVDVAPQSLMGRSVLGEPGYVTEERVTASDDCLWHRTEASYGGDLCVAYVVLPADSGYLALAFHMECLQTYEMLIISLICTKQQFIHLLTAAFKDLHIKNSKNHKKVILPASHWLCVNVLLNNVTFLWLLQTTRSHTGVCTLAWDRVVCAIACRNPPRRLTCRWVSEKRYICK